VTLAKNGGTAVDVTSSVSSGKYKLTSNAANDANDTFVLTATFKSATTYYTITSSVDANGGGTVSPTTASVAKGASHVVTATPATGYQVSAYTVTENGVTTTYAIWPGCNYPGVGNNTYTFSNV